MLLWLTVALSFLSSMIAKWLADAFLHGRVAVIGSFLGLQYSLNPGIAFSITFPGPLQTLLIVVALLAMIVVAVRSAHSPQSQIAFGLIIGGAFGNIADRLLDGAVTDFVQVGTFPVFNVADSCITVGVALLLLEMALRWRAGKEEKQGK